MEDATELTIPKNEGAEQPETLTPEQEVIQLRQRNKELLEQNKILEELARIDALTGLDNRRSFEEEIHREIAKANRHGRPLSLIFVDVDLFKEINDKEGHSGGDLALKIITEDLKNGIREEDRVFRYGGDEMTVLLPDTDLETAIKRAEHLQQTRESIPININSKKRTVTASFGVATFIPGQTMGGADELTSGSDTGMYAAKAAGKNMIGYTDVNGQVFVIEKPTAASPEVAVAV